MSQSFLSSNSPKCIADLFGMNDQTAKFSNWLSKFSQQERDTCKAFLICGDVGVGKSTIAKVVMQDMGYTVLEYSGSEFKGSKQLKETLSQVIGEDNVSKALYTDQKMSTKVAVLIDNVEGISILEKNGLSELVYAINPLRGRKSVRKNQREKIANTWGIPIVCVSTDSGDKRSIELRKDCELLDLPGWTVAERISFIKGIFRKYEKDITSQEMTLIVQVCGVDIRKILHVVFEILSCKQFQSTSLALASAQGIIDGYRKGTSKSDVYADTEKILFDDVTVSEALSMHSRHRMLLSLMVHENYPKLLDTIQNEEVRLTEAYKLMDGITMSDQIDNYVYDSQNWNLPPYSAMMGAIYPNLILNKYCQYNGNKRPSIKFTSNLSKTSLQYTNIKTINSFIFRYSNPTFSWEDMTTLIQIYENLKEENSDASKQLLLKYNLFDDIIEKIKKANKVDMATSIKKLM